MSFNLPYKFQQSGREVVVQHSHGGHIRVHPNNMTLADGGGGQGQFARWRIYLEGQHHCRLQSVKTGKYLRIWRGGKETDVNGGTGPFTKFRIHYHSRPNGVKLESDRFPGRYIAVNPNRTMKIGGGGHHCNLWIKREGGAQHRPQPQPVRVVHQPKPKPVVQVVQGGAAFNLPYHFKQNNLIVIKSNYGKHLRVNPNNTYAADGNGGTGKFAQWRVMLDGLGVIKLQNTHTGKYLRIEGNDAVNVGGGGGQLTRFRYHIHSSPNGVKLESCRFPGKYIAIRPNGVVCKGAGGVHTQLTFWRQNNQKPQVIIRPPQPQPKPVVIVQQPRPVQPQVIVQQPSPNYAQQQQAAMQQAQIAAQQQQMQQQMEQMRLQQEASLNAQKQQMELEKQQLAAQQAQLAQQQEAVLESQRVLLQQQASLSNSNLQQQQQQPQMVISPKSMSGSPAVQQYEGVSTAQPAQPYNPEVVAYPVLNQQPDIPNEQEMKKPEVVPVQGQEAANEVLVWLTKLSMERYYKTFIENGYDQLEAIGDITREDLKEMGVALGHIKIIVAASITAPFMNKRVRLKSVSHDTYLQNYGSPKDMKPGKRCVLQHNDKKENAGAVWIFECIDDGTTSGSFRLKHAVSGSWLRIMKAEEEADTRSPFGAVSDLILEKHETVKGVYFIKGRKTDLYLSCEKPRSFGYNQTECLEKRGADCRFNVSVIKR